MKKEAPQPGMLYCSGSTTQDYSTTKTETRFCQLHFADTYRRWQEKKKSNETMNLRLETGRK